MKTTLATIKKTNARVTQHGVVNYTNADGSPAEVGGYGKYSMFPPELIMLACLYIYKGEKEFGLELVRKCWHNITNRQGLAWDQVNIFRGDKDTGERVFGADYYQNMMLWSLPAAVHGQNMGASVEKGGFVQRIIEAAQKGQ